MIRLDTPPRLPIPMAYLLVLVTWFEEAGFSRTPNPRRASDPEGESLTDVTPLGRPHSVGDGRVVSRLTSGREGTP